MLNKAQEEMPSASDIDKAGDIELQENLIEKHRKHRESQPASPGRAHRGFTHARTPGFRCPTQKHSRLAKGGGSKESSVGRAHQERASKARGI